MGGDDVPSFEGSGGDGENPSTGRLARHDDLDAHYEAIEEERRLVGEGHPPL
jgi:hypothetical protein